MWRFHKKLEIELPYDPSVCPLPLLDMHTDEIRIERDVCTPMFTAALFTLLGHGKTWMSISRWMDKEAVVHIHNRILLKYKKENIWVCSNEVDKTVTYYTELSKSERETPIKYINAYIWNLERWWLWSYMQDSKRDTDIKNRLSDSVGEGKGGMI